MALILPRNYHKITAVEHLAFEDVTYWPELVELINKARHSCASTLGLCWAGFALAYLAGVNMAD